MTTYMMNQRTSGRGFSLIEVMLAVLVLAIGILAVSKLQTSLIRSGGDANARSVAASIGQKKIDDLRRFIHLTTSRPDIPDAWTAVLSPSSLAYNHITSNTGGLTGVGPVTYIGNIDYSVSWSVVDYYYSGLNSVATTTPVAGSQHSDFKMASIIVSWDDVGGERKNVTLDTIIEARSPVFTGLGEDTTAAGSAPIAKYTPQSAPDVVPVTIDADGVKKETNKPVPEISNKAHSTEVLFETVTYNTDKDTLRREEFRTLSCDCKSGATDTAAIIARGLTTWDAVEGKIVDVVHLTTGGIVADVNDQGDSSTISQNCFFCCKNGRSGTGSSSGNSTQVCRLKRVDGILRVFHPWKMIGFNLIPASYFNDDDSGLSGMTSAIQATNISTYSSYVTNLVRNALLAHATSTTFNAMTTIDISFASVANSYINSGPITHTNINGTSTIRPLQVRAIYMDYPPNGVYESATYTATNVPLDRISFYEVNMTQLAGWVPDNDDLTFGADYTNQHDSTDVCSSTSVNCVNNEELVDGGNYKRGEFIANVNTPTTTEVSSRIYTSNDGVVDRAINSETTIDVSIDITVH